MPIVAAPSAGSAAVPSGATGLHAQFPATGEQPIRFDLPSGGSFQVRELDARDAATPAGAALSYSRRGGRSYWTRTAAGYEEWLLLEAGIACRGVEAAAWEVSGAALRQRGEAIEVVTGPAHPRVRVTAPIAYAAGGREVPVTISAVGARISIEVDAGCEAALVDPAWVLATPMLSPRSAHAETLLPDGRVLMTGGLGANGTAMSAVEIYDVAGDIWSAGAPMAKARMGHQATRLSDGKVLVTGGWAAFTLSSAVEIYDPLTNTWSPAAPMQKARFRHTATRLDSGNVLVAGGFGVDEEAPLSAELYDPVTNLWKPLPPMSAPRSFHTATRLLDGRVLVWGGPGSAMFPTLSTPFNLFDPTTETWTSTKLLEPTRQRHTATLLPNGNVLIAGGEVNGVPLGTVQIFEPGSEDRSFTTPLLEERSEHTATLLSNGNVLVTGGYKLDNGAIWLKSTEIFYVENNRWSFSAELNQARHGHTATALLDTRVLVAGGEAGPELATAEIFGTALGDPCATVKDCPSGFCVDGVCCDAACELGQCDACSVAAGGPKDGECSILTDAPCDDGFVCTEGSTCDAAGICQGGAPLVCEASGECLTSACNPATGDCEETPHADGVFCSIGTCKSGVCEEPPDAGVGGVGGVGGGAGGMGGAGGQPPPQWEPFTVQGGGCSCAAPGSPPRRGQGWLAGALLGLALLRRVHSRKTA